MNAASYASITIVCLAGLAAAAVAAPLPPISGLYLQSFRAFDWSVAGYREGLHIPSPPVRFNVLQYGAKGDGVADDTRALQAAVAAANANPGGGVVYVPAGNYKLTQPLTITRSGVVLRGAGPTRSVIHIPKSLSDVFKNTWILKSNGAIESAWTAGGGFINIAGRRMRSTDKATFLARINGFVQKNPRVLPVDDTTRFRIGWRVRVFLNDRSTMGSRRRLLSAGTPLGGRRPVFSGGKLNSSRASAPTLLTPLAPAWVRNHPAFKAAMESSALLSEDGGLTRAQALAADKAYYQAAGGIVGSAAAQGTITAWLYGDNMVDSGTATGVVDQDELSFTAIVVSLDRRRGLVTLDRNLPFPIVRDWKAVVHVERPSVQDSGIESLGIRFTFFKTQPHFGERGYNGIQVSGAANCWVRNVRIDNADSGIFFNWVDRSTIWDVVINATENRADPRWPTTLNGHHALSISEGHGNMLARFNVAAPYIHDVSLSSATSLNVVMEGRGVSLNFDHHRTAPWGNLVTSIILGDGARAFRSGGRQGRGAHSGLLNTYWNLRSLSGQPVPLPDDCGFGPKLNFIGNYAGNTCPAMSWVVRPLKPTDPPNLFRAQWLERNRRAAAQKKVSG